MFDFNKDTLKQFFRLAAKDYRSVVNSRHLHFVSKYRSAIKNSRAVIAEAETIEAQGGKQLSLNL